MSMRETLIHQISLAARFLGLKPSTVSSKIFGDGNRYEYYKNGGGLTERSFEKARAWFDAQGIDFEALESEYSADGCGSETASPS